MKNLGPLTNAEERIMARLGWPVLAVIVCEIQRMPAERLQARGYVRLARPQKWKQRGPNEIRVEITRAGRESRQKWRKKPAGS